MVQRITRNASRPISYWGPDPHKRMVMEKTPQKVRVGLEDQLRTNGRPAWLWLPLPTATHGTVPCTCDKETTQNADFKCLSCYGTRQIPGYRKFLFQTLFWASAEAPGYSGPTPAAQDPYVLTGCALDRTRKPNRIVLTPGTGTGTIETIDKPFTNDAGEDWELELVAYRKTAGDTLALEVSFDEGVTWDDVTLTPGPTFGFRGEIAGAIGDGTMRFRLTMTRVTASAADSPVFEILRVRRVRSEDVNPILHQRTDTAPGQILILKTWDQEFVAREIARGRTVEAMGDRGLTAPLDFFDTTLVRDTPAAAFDDRDTGPHPFFEFARGVRTAQRYAIYAINLDATIDDVMTHQSFSERRVQQGELYSLVY